MAKKRMSKTMMYNSVICRVYSALFSPNLELSGNKFDIDGGSERILIMEIVVNHYV